MPWTMSGSGCCVAAGLAGRQAAVGHVNSDRRSVCTNKRPAASSEGCQLLVLHGHCTVH